MAAKKKKINPEVIWEQDDILVALKERYFRLYAKENMGKTRDITKLLNELEITINKRKQELVGN